jgi:uncharacterized membrane protein
MVLDILLIVAVVGAGLGSGIFLAFSAGVMPGLVRASAETYVSAVREMNIAIPKSPAFVLPLFLPPFLLGGAAIAAFVTGETITAVILVVAAVAFLIGGPILTGGRNIPLNNALEASRGSNATAAREAFDRPWRAWNHARTLLTLVGFALAVAAVVLR